MSLFILIPLVSQLIFQNIYFRQFMKSFGEIVSPCLTLLLISKVFFISFSVLVDI